MAEYAVLHVDNLVKIDPAVPLDRAALVGCAVTTGVGAVFNTAKVTPGSSVAVFGCGGVGLNVIQGARIAGAGRIVAIDTMQSKLDMAKQFGATDVLLGKEDPVKALKKLTGGGPDYAFECVGNGELAATAYRSIGRGGLAVVVGVAKPGDSTAVRTMTLPFEEKTLTGSYFGSCVPRIDFPAHAVALHGRPAQARRADHAPLLDRGGARRLRRHGVRKERAWRDRIQGITPRMAERILVVDDQRTTAEMVAGLLTNLGYEVQIAADGMAALERVRAARARPGGLGHQHAADGRLRAVPPPARRFRQRASAGHPDHLDRGAHRAHQGHRGGRRRLPDEAGQLAGAVRPRASGCCG